MFFYNFAIASSEASKFLSELETLMCIFVLEHKPEQLEKILRLTIKPDYHFIDNDCLQGNSKLCTMQDYRQSRIEEDEIYIFRDWLKRYQPPYLKLI